MRDDARWADEHARSEGLVHGRRPPERGDGACLHRRRDDSAAVADAGVLRDKAVRNGEARRDRACRVAVESRVGLAPGGRAHTGVRRRPGRVSAGRQVDRSANADQRARADVGGPRHRLRSAPGLELVPRLDHARASRPVATGAPRLLAPGRPAEPHRTLAPRAVRTLRRCRACALIRVTFAGFTRGCRRVRSGTSDATRLRRAHDS